MFSTQAIRLLREKWKSPTALAEEIYAIFQDKLPVSSGPITIDTGNDPGTPGLTFKTTVGATPLQIQTADGNIDFTVGPDGGLVFNGPSFTVNGTQPGQQQQTSNTYPGKVVSGGGTDYQVKIYPNGTAQAGLTVPVTQLQADPNSVIPADTWALVCSVNGKYYMQVPVWL